MSDWHFSGHPYLSWSILTDSLSKTLCNEWKRNLKINLGCGFQEVRIWMLGRTNYRCPLCLLGHEVGVRTITADIYQVLTMCQSLFLVSST